MKDVQFPVNDPIVQLFGKLYETCRLSNWDYHGTAEEKHRQREIVDWCGQFNLDMAAHVQLGRNVIFVGRAAPARIVWRFLCAVVRWRISSPLLDTLVRNCGR